MTDKKKILVLAILAGVFAIISLIQTIRLSSAHDHIGFYRRNAEADKWIIQDLRLYNEDGSIRRK